MKKLFKTLAALAVVAALGFGFVSCGDSGDDNNGNSGNNNTNPAQTETALAVFTCDTAYDKRTLTFNEDSTFKVIVSDETGSQAEGTYTLDSGNWENGTISMTATSGTKASTFTGTKTISEKKITFSTKTYTLTGGTKKAPSKNSEPDTKKDDEENKGQETTTETATFTSTEFYGGTIKIEYKADGSYLMTWSLSGYTTNKGKGTYTLTGTFDNGTIHQHQTHSSDTLGTGWVAEAEDNDLVVTNGSFNVQLEDEDGVETVTFTKTTADESDNENDSGDEEEASTSAAFAGEPDGYKLLFKFNNDTYVIYMNGKEDEKGTYTLTGNFKNGTIKLTKTHKYEYGYDGNGEWKEEERTTDCKITDGTLERWSSKYETVSYDYDVTQDLPPINVSINSNLYGAHVESQSVKYGEKVTKPEAPLADGFIFDNWYSDKELTTLFDFDKPISTEEYRECRYGEWYLHIYGKWTVDSEFKDNWTLEITNNDTTETVTNDYKAAIKALEKASSGSTIKISGLLIDAYTSNIDNYYGELRSELNRSALNREYNLDLSELSIREKKTPYSYSNYMYDYYYGEGCWNVGYYGNGKIWKDSSSRIKTLKTPKSGDFEVESLPECTKIIVTKGTKKFYMAKRASENLISFSFEDEEGWRQVGRSDFDNYTSRPVSNDITSWVKHHDNIKFENTRS